MCADILQNIYHFVTNKVCDWVFLLHVCKNWKQVAFSLLSSLYLTHVPQTLISSPNIRNQIRHLNTLSGPVCLRQVELAKQLTGLQTVAISGFLLSSFLYDYFDTNDFSTHLCLKHATLAYFKTVCFRTNIAVETLIFSHVIFENCNSMHANGVQVLEFISCNIDWEMTSFSIISDSLHTLKITSLKNKITLFEDAVFLSPIAKFDRCPRLHNLEISSHFATQYAPTPFVQVILSKFPVLEILTVIDATNNDICNLIAEFQIHSNVTVITHS